MAPKFTTLLAGLAALAPFAAQAAPAPWRPESTKETPQGLGVAISNADVDSKHIVPNSYIVVYNNTFGDEDIDVHQQTISSTIAKRNLGKRGINGQALSTSVSTFKMSGWRAMALEADDLMMNTLNADSMVSYVEANMYVKALDLQMQNNAPNGLARISHAQAGEQGYIFDDTAGEGITAYIVDTGIMTTHEEFQGRATLGFNSIDNVVSCDLFAKWGLARTEGKIEGDRRANECAARIPTRTATALTSPVPSVVPPSASPRKRT